MSQFLVQVICELEILKVSECYPLIEFQSPKTKKKTVGNNIPESQGCASHREALMSSALWHPIGTALRKVLSQSLVRGKAILSSGSRPSASRASTLHHCAKPTFCDLTKPMMGEPGRVTPAKVYSQSPVYWCWSQWLEGCLLESDSILLPHWNSFCHGTPAHNPWSWYSVPCTPGSLI